MPNSSTIVGAGVSGLSTGIRLREAGWDAHIIAREMPHDSVSVVAAAVWTTTEAAPVARTRPWAIRSREVFEGLAQVPGTGVVPLRQLELERHDPGRSWWEDTPWVTSVDQLPDGYEAGLQIDGFMVEPPIYLDWLLAGFHRLGAGGVYRLDTILSWRHDGLMRVGRRPIRRSTHASKPLWRTGRLVRNPAGPARKNLPRLSDREMPFRTHEEVERLVMVVDEPWRTLFYTLAYTGIRWGEAVSLRRKRCHILKAKLHIAESLAEVNGVLHFGEPKSNKSRWVDMPRFVGDMLGAHIGTHVGANDGNALVFTSPRGAPVRHSNFYTSVWRPAVRDAALPGALRIHDLRHTAASFMIYEGAHMELIRQQLGHSSVMVTQRYAHLYPSQGEDLAARLDSRKRSTIDHAVGL